MAPAAEDAGLVVDSNAPPGPQRGRPTAGATWRWAPTSPRRSLFRSRRAFHLNFYIFKCVCFGFDRFSPERSEQSCC